MIICKRAAIALAISQISECIIFPFIAEPNVNIVWSDSAEGKMVALRDIEKGPFFEPSVVLDLFQFFIAFAGVCYALRRFCMIALVLGVS